MASFGSADFEVRWMPFQLNDQASKTGVNKMQMYMQKFNMTKERCMEMSKGMAQNFAAVGLPYKFTEKGLTGNTFNSHRLLEYAWDTGGAETQDKVVESLFKSYFAEERFLNDPQVLLDAAKAGGLPEDEAKAFVADETQHASATHAAMDHGRRLQVRGVPYFEITCGPKRAELSGAQPEGQFLAAFKQVCG